MTVLRAHAFAEALLTVWETQRDAHPVRRALAVLEAAWPEMTADEWADAPVGRRDGCLLDLHELLFGSELATTARCPKCSERLESSFATGDVRVAPATRVSASPAASFRASFAGYDVEYRLPSSADMLAVAAQADRDAAVRELLRRCVRTARDNGRDLDAAALPAALVGQLGEEMARADPEAEIRLGLTCPACDHAWSLAFDIVHHFWGQLEEWAQRTLLDVHTLAGAYGWTERDVLALTPARRQLYVEMVRA